MTTTQTSLVVEQAICRTADFYRTRYSKETWNKLSDAERADAKNKLQAFRDEGCPAILSQSK